MGGTLARKTQGVAEKSATPFVHRFLWKGVREVAKAVGYTTLGGRTLAEEGMLDITAPETEVEVTYSEKNRAGEQVLWVNVEGRCVLRICQISNGLSILGPDGLRRVVEQ